MTTQRFAGKVMVVTGAAQGIGRGVALRASAEGARVVFVDRAEFVAEVAAEAVGESAGFVADLETYEGAAAAMAFANERFGGIDILINGVGGAIRMRPFAEFEPAQIDAEIRRSLMPTLYTCHAVLPYLLKRGGGTIVNVSSVHGRSAFNMWAAYDVAKAGIDALTRYIAVEYGPVGIRANAVAPGAVRTALVQRVIRDSPNSAVAEREMSIQHPLERIGEPEEIAAAVAWLISSEASFVTGQSLAVDGGLTSRCYRYDPDAKLLAMYGKG